MRARSPSLVLAAAAAASLASASALAEEPCQPVKPCDAVGAPGAEEPPAELRAEVRAFFDLLSCRATPPGLDARTVAAFCSRQRPALAAYRAHTLPALRAALDPLRGQRVPTAVVYPFSGPDLFGPLAAYPGARSVTTLSPTPAGDARGLAPLRDRARLRAFLDEVARASAPLLSGQGGEAVVRAGAGAPAFALFLTALAAHGLEPVGLRYFRVEASGGLHFLTARELSAAGPAALGSAELTFVAPGEDPADARVHRHLGGAPLSDAALAQAPGIAAYLAARGKVAVLVRGAGDRLAGAGALRRAVLARAAVVLGDPSAPSAEEARAAGLVREVHPAPVAFGAARAGAADGLVVLRRP